MKNIQQRQSDLVNDTCNDCGSYADIGAVIDEHDTVLILQYSLEQQQTVDELVTKAQSRFDDVRADITQDDAMLTLKLQFQFSAEKMIFQLENHI
ncbi:MULTISPECIES: DUF406 family protein [Shewanella]|uniref:DUF406 family protein n=1 Tax=Shewanella TaxID=22 RepID=UPI00048CFEAA|nr:MULTISPECIES: DUF406 family protein [Shewanella]QLE85656.1 DUF406 family protein [Shewanella sp. Scap07]